MCEKIFNAEKSEKNRLELCTFFYDKLYKLTDGIKFGNVAVNFTLHDGEIVKYDFSYTEKIK